jgi:glycosyltransferase involved in cell wall biosynthesis
MGQLTQSAVDMFIAVSHATAEYNGLIRANLPFQIIPDFVRDDIGEALPGDDPHIAQLPEDGYILFVGDLSGEKGVHVLLHAYGQLQDAPPLVLIGRWGQDTPTRFPPNVLAFNKWPHTAVMQAWRRCSIALAPSVWSEPFGIVVLEAMASGRPVIASRAGGLTDMVIDGETGLLVPPGDVDALRQALERLLADAPLRERLGAAAKRKVNEFKASTVLPRIEQLYESVIAQNYANRLPKRHGDEEQTFWSISDT